jgi:GAF domain-containing protein
MKKHQSFSPVVRLFSRSTMDCHLGPVGIIVLRNVTSEILVPYATIEIPPDFTRLCGDVRVGDQCCGRAVLHKKPWIVANMLTDPLFASGGDAVANSPIRAGFSVPVLEASGECIGALGCVFREPHSPTTEQISQNEIWADFIARTIADAWRVALQAASSAASIPQNVLPIASLRPSFCSICGRKIVSLETTRTDQHGHTVHEDCYVLKVRLHNATKQ